MAPTYTLAPVAGPSWDDCADGVFTAHFPTRSLRLRLVYGGAPAFRAGIALSGRVRSPELAE